MSEPDWLCANKEPGPWRWYRAPEKLSAQSRLDQTNLGIIAGAIYILLVAALTGITLIQSAAGHDSLPFYGVLLVVLLPVVLLWCAAWLAMRSGRIYALIVDVQDGRIGVEDFAWHGRPRIQMWSLSALERGRALVLSPGGWGQDDGCLELHLSGQVVHIRMDLLSLRRCVSELRRVLPEQLGRLELESRILS